MQDDYQRQTFDFERDHWWYRGRRKIILSMVDRHLPPSDRRRLLEIGCGAGTTLHALRNYGEAIGVDPCPEAIDVARRRAGCDVRRGALPDDLPDDLGRFDAVCLFDVIEHLDDDARGLEALLPLLAPNARVFITVPAQPWLFGVHDELNRHRRRYTARSLRAAMTAAGLQPIETTHCNTLLSPALIPAILWRNHRRAGHHFEVRSRLDPLLERTFAFERHLLRRVRLPFGLSLLAVARAARPTLEPSAGAIRRS